MPVRTRSSISQPSSNGTSYSNGSSISNGLNGIEQLQSEADDVLQTTKIPVSKAALTPSQPTTPMYEAIDLVVSVLGIYICYLIYAVLQERLTASTHSKDSNQVDEHMFLMLVQCTVNALVVCPFVYYIERNQSPTTNHSIKPSSYNQFGAITQSLVRYPQLAYACIGLTYCGGMLTSYWSFAYINYPTSVLVKSCKMVPVMLIGVIVFQKRYTLREYICVMGLTAGIYGFMYYGSGNKVAASAPASSLYGIVLSGVSLLCDGFTGSQQDNFVSIHHPTSYRLMFETNKWAVIELLIASALTGELYNGVTTAVTNPTMMYDLLIFGGVSAIGQLFIFHMITTFGALALAITTSTRKLATILCSTVMFGHYISPPQWLCVLIVFSSLMIDIVGKAQAKKKKSTVAKKVE